MEKPFSVTLSFTCAFFAMTLIANAVPYDIVRDEVRPFIMDQYREPRLNQALLQYAKALQMGLESPSKQESFKAADEMSRAMECLEYVAPNNTAWRTVHAKTVNTPDRISAWMQYERRLSGYVFKTNPKSDWKRSCDFDS